MYYAFYSIEDNILNYVYFINNCTVTEIETQVLRTPETEQEDISSVIYKLEKQKLLCISSAYNVSLTEEGVIAVENYDSYDAYLSFKITV